MQKSISTFVNLAGLRVRYCNFSIFMVALRDTLFNTQIIRVNKYILTFSKVNGFDLRKIQVFRETILVKITMMYVLFSFKNKVFPSEDCVMILSTVRNSLFGNSKRIFECSAIDNLSCWRVIKGFIFIKIDIVIKPPFGIESF